ncbi:MAG: hypothetical protein K6E67_09535 [Prevotella sp.]|nr:hypothetical protein [Prevotella sp.]
MKKNYIAPSMRIKEIAVRKMLCGSSLGISNTSTSSQWSRSLDIEDEDY